MKKAKLVNSSVTKSKMSPLTVVLFVLLMTYTLILFVPMLWALITSLTDNDWYQTFYNFKAFKNAGNIKLTFNNFKNAWTYLKVESETTERIPVSYKYDVVGLFENSLLYAVGCAVAFTVCPTITAYATARFKFKFSNVIYTFVIIAIALPIVGSAPSEINMLYNLNLDTWFHGMWILRFNFLSIYYLILHATFESIPKDYTEAAKIDGASNMTIFLRVILPQALNAIVTIFILSFISYWNDYQIPLLYMPAYPTAASAIYLFTLRGQGGNVTNQVPVQLAGALIMILPILLVYIIFNKKLRVSVAMGGIKS